MLAVFFINTIERVFIGVVKLSDFLNSALSSLQDCLHFLFGRFRANKEHVF
jgi:hypothetical protein